ncbi:unnamed protein product, partial [Lymnaea stagnalis]
VDVLLDENDDELKVKPLKKKKKKRRKDTTLQAAIPTPHQSDSEQIQSLKGKRRKKLMHSFAEHDGEDDLLLLEDSTNNIVNYLALEEEEDYFGQIQSNIVGIRYYKGMVSNKEMVTLVREPHNKFDRNAVKVLNMASQQVGHIARQHAVALAVIMDKSLARVEGTIPYGATGNFQIPVDIHLWGSPENKEEVFKVIKSHNVPSGPRQDLAIKNQGKRNARHVLSSRSLVTPQEMQNELDKIFETLDEGDKRSETEPADAVGTVLYPHQKQALNWMISKENTDTLPPFWEDHNGRYWNTLTMFTSDVKPSSVHGGILADDMGLGKTLEMISLILSNFVDGKPLAYPLPGTCRLPFGSENMSPFFFLYISFFYAVKKIFIYLTFATHIFFNCFYRETQTHQEIISIFFSLTEEASFSGNQYSDPTPCYQREIKHNVLSQSSFQDCHMTKTYITKQTRQYIIINIKYSTKAEIQSRYDNKYKLNALPTTHYAKHCMNYYSRFIFVDNSFQPWFCSTETELQESLPVVPAADKKIKTVSGSANDIDVIDLTAEDELPDISPSTSHKKFEGTVIRKIKFSILNEFFLIEELPSNCELTSGRSLTHSPRATLIICPLSVVSNWVDQFEAHVQKTVHIFLHVYYGQNRTKTFAFLKNQDVVITTYSTLASDFKMGETRSPLHKVEWLRIVLDEGHIIRNHSAQQTKAVFELKAERRWILTGTPIQNSIKDFWSMLNFLKVQPFTEKLWWNRTIAKPVYRREKAAIPRVAHLMRNLAMRRTKNQKYNGERLVALPARKVYLEKITLSEDERKVYDAMQTKGQTLIGRYFQNETLLHNYGQVLAILMRLRQLCCHPQLVAKALAKVKENDPEDKNDTTKKKLIDQLMTVLLSGSDEECVICLESLNNAVITPCAHVYCRPCIEAVLKTKKSEQCPLCRGDVEKNQLIEVPKEQNDGDTAGMDSDDWQSSSKVDALMQALNSLRQEDPRVKSVVVSQFTSLLTILEKPLSMEGFVYCRFDGSMSAAERTEVLRNFSQTHAGSPTVLLLSLKAGGVGINLTAASRVFLMDPAWNPASEDQCFDRCHRLGQTKDVIITKVWI